ncbi:hypothetical protein INR49_030360 [Caranx melampygus]|nr:hypothetical protein INR49_030360 [Caranx melampygus]
MTLKKRKSQIGTAQEEEDTILFISGTKAKCLAVSQIKGLLLPPRKSCCRGWGGFSPVPPSSHRLGFPWEAADWHPDCQPDDGSYQENQTEEEDEVERKKIREEYQTSGKKKKKKKKKEEEEKKKTLAPETFYLLHLSFLISN